jgi:C4-dicarboxylate-specific signal transduction histidine kinase
MNKAPSIRQQLRLEIARRGIPASITFAVIGIVMALYPFGRDSLATWMRIWASLAVLASGARLVLSRQAAAAGYVSPARYGALSGAIVINALAWALFFAFSHAEAVRENESYHMSFVLMIGFCTASLVSLSASRRLSLTFVVANVGGQVALFAYFALFTAYPIDRTAFVLLPIFLIYLMNEASRLRAQMVERFQAQLRLETANRRLVRSRQELMEQTARTQHASRLASLGEMAGGIAHEVNNPLAIIDLSFESFKITHARLYGAMDPKAAAILERGQKAIRRISAIVKGLRNFSRAGDHDPMVDVTVGQIVEDTLGLCSEKMKAHSVELKIEGDLAQKLHCRPIEIAQVLINLINNAYDVVSHLEAAARKITISARSEGGRIILAVSNPGPLISEPVAQKLFQPFFTTKAPGEGTGLGLSVSHAIARKHGGDLYLVAGAPLTTFVLELPSAPVASA